MGQHLCFPLYITSLKQRNYRLIAQAYSPRSQMRITTSKTPRSEDSNITAPLHCPEPIPLGIGRGKQQGKSHTAIALCPCTLGALSGNPNAPFISSQVPRQSFYHPSVGRCGGHHSVLGHCLESCLEGFIPTNANQHAEAGTG